MCKHQPSTSWSVEQFKANVSKQYDSYFLSEVNTRQISGRFCVVLSGPRDQVEHFGLGEVFQALMKGAETIR